MTLVVRNAGRLVTCDPELGEGVLGVIDKGALVADGARISWVGRERDLGARVTGPRNSRPACAGNPTGRAGS
jgi:hypothetical protein